MFGVKNDFTSMLHSLARIQNSMHREIAGNRLSTFVNNSIYNEGGRMTLRIREIQKWLLDWNALLECFVNHASYIDGEQNQTTQLLRYYGELQQGEAPLLANLTTEHHNQPLLSVQEIEVCKQILRAAYGIYHISILPTNALSSCVPCLVFPLTWTYAHTIFNATAVMLQNVSADCSNAEDVSALTRKSLEVLNFLDNRMKLSTKSLASYLEIIMEQVLA